MRILSYIGRVRYFLRIFKPAYKHLKNSLPVLLFLGLIIAIATVWWLGPKWEVNNTFPLGPLMPRILATVVLLFIAASCIAIYTHKRLNISEQERLKDQEKDPFAPYIEANEARLNEKLTLLKENQLGKDYIYSLPWFIVMGDSDAGKTSLINRSDQQFSLTTTNKASWKTDGIRSRRDAIDIPHDIDWWMSDDAILIDPDGGLLTQSGTNTDQDGLLAGRLWEQFVEWLGRTRSRRPLNGVVLVIDLARLINQKPSDRKAYAGIFRTRMRELMEQLGTRLPVYIVLSKFDLINGFSNFFHGLPKSRRDEIYGTTFSIKTLTDYDTWLDELDIWYDNFLEMLNEQTFEKMASTTVLEERENLFSFVRQLVGIKQTLQEFLADILESDRFSTPAMVRGLYFTSVYQQGIPVNPFIDASARTYQIPLSVSSALPAINTATYFTRTLFSKVIYPEAGLASDNIKITRQKQRVLKVGAAVAAMGVLSVLAGWQFYYDRNYRGVETVLDSTTDYKTTAVSERIDTTGENLLEPLSHIRTAAKVFEGYEIKPPWVAEMGLYQGRVLGPRTEQVYKGFLSKHFLPALATGVVEQMNTAPYASDEKLIGLKVYRMIEDKDNRRKKIVKDWMRDVWNDTFDDNIATKRQLMSHLDYAMDHVDADLPQFSRWMRDTQTELLTIPFPDRVYRALKQKASAEFASPLDIRRQIGPAFDVIYKHEKERGVMGFIAMDASVFQVNADRQTVIDESDYLIASMLTKPGFKEYFVRQNEDIAELAMIDTWALGLRNELDYSDADKKQLRQQVREIYIADYISSWRRALDKLNVNNFKSIPHAVTVLDTLAGSTTPLQRLIKTVKNHTRIYPQAIQAEDETGADTAAGATAAVTAVANEALQKDPNRKQAHNIESAFNRLTGLLEQKNDKPAYIEEVLKSITGLQDYMKQIMTASNPGNKALTSAYDRFTLKVADPITLLNRVANGLPMPLNRQLNKVANESWRVLLIRALEELERKWDKEVYSFYEKRLKNQYPLKIDGEDASLDDFTRFFGPKGILDSFYNDYLKMFVESNLEVLYSEARNSYLIREDLIEQIKKAQLISEAYFNSAGALHVPFSIEPLAMSGSHRRSVLNIDGQIITYNHGPTHPVDLLWPNTLQNRTESKLVLISSSGRNATVKFRGPWSWFHLLERGNISETDSDGSTLSYQLKGGIMRYRLRGESANNPLNHNNPLKGFALPRYLLSESKAVEAMAKAPTRDEFRRPESQDNYQSGAYSFGL